MTAKLSITEIRRRAARFTQDFKKSDYEMGEAQNFIRELCEVFGIRPLRIVNFEHRVKKLGGRKGRIDGLLPGKLLIEMKSRGEDMEKAYLQATEYLPGLKDEELPQYVLVSDFANLHLYDRVAGGEPLRIKLEDLSQHLDPFLFLADYEYQAQIRQEKITQTAAERMGELHDALKQAGCEGKDLETYLVRLLFCFFADDSDLFHRKGAFHDYIINHTHEDGHDLHSAFDQFFYALNLAEDSPRRAKLAPQLADFPYINGALFSERLDVYHLNSAVRDMVLACSVEDWSEISPAIFGSMFQAVMHHENEAGKAKAKKRRELGAHYTSEENILKVIRPLFMDELNSEFARARRDEKTLVAFHEKLATLKFLDPACGCGNFLVIAYRELRLLELAVIDELRGINQRRGKHKGSLDMDVDSWLKCNVNQFYGIEIDATATQIATVAMWLTDHQMNMKVTRMGTYYKRIPLTARAQITCANALQVDWEAVIPATECNYVMGNPPFIGRQYQTAEQKADMDKVFGEIKGAGVLDYVAAWYFKAALYIQKSPQIPIAFVSTNSITQGEQVPVLWGLLLRDAEFNGELFQKMHIHFAHRTFRWSNEGRGIAAVHCVIVGFGLMLPTTSYIYEMSEARSDVAKIAVKRINPYLVDAPTIFIDKRRKPISASAPEMVFGNMPNDGGHLLLSEAECEAIKITDVVAGKYIRPFLGSEEFINNLKRYCFWLLESTSQDRKTSSELRRRIESVKTNREASTRPATRKLAETPFLFGEIRQKEGVYLAVPEVSSESRQFIPIGFLKDEVASNKLYMIPNASLFEFGVVTSSMHMAWMRAVGGRLKSDYQYSAGIVYNNFIWPEALSPAQKVKISDAAQKILDARKQEEDLCAEQNQSCSLATLYAPNNMPLTLLKAHQALDKAVDAAYGYKGGAGDAQRVAFLFERYVELTQ